MSERNQIFREIQTVIAGRSEKEVLHALAACLVIAIGVSSESKNHAIATIKGLPGDMKSVLDQEWPKLRAHRARSDLRRSIEAGEPIH